MSLVTRLFFGFLAIVVLNMLIQKLVEGLDIVVKFWIFDLSGFFKSLILVVFDLVGLLFLTAMRTAGVET